MPKFGKAQLASITPLDVRRFVAEQLASTIEPRYRALVLTAGFTGARWGELAGLKTSRLNLLKGAMDVVAILTAMKGYLLFGPPKTARGRRTIILSRFLCDELHQHLGEHASGDLVFTGTDGAALRRSNFSRQAWKPALKRAGIETCDSMTSDTAVAFLIALVGCHPAEIATRMGWSSVAVMLTRYGHLLPSLDDRVRDGLDAMYLGSAAAHLRPNAAQAAISLAPASS